MGCIVKPLLISQSNSLCTPTHVSIMKMLSWRRVQFERHLPETHSLTKLDLAECQLLFIRINIATPVAEGWGIPGLETTVVLGSSPINQRYVPESNWGHKVCGRVTVSQIVGQGEICESIE